MRSRPWMRRRTRRGARRRIIPRSVVTRRGRPHHHRCRRRHHHRCGLDHHRCRLDHDRRRLSDHRDRSRLDHDRRRLNDRRGLSHYDRRRLSHHYRRRLGHHHSPARSENVQGCPDQIDDVRGEAHSARTAAVMMMRRSAGAAGAAVRRTGQYRHPEPDHDCQCDPNLHLILPHSVERDHEIRFFRIITRFPKKSNRPAKFPQMLSRRPAEQTVERRDVFRRRDAVTPP